MKSREPAKRFVLNEIFHLNVLKYVIFYVYKNPYNWEFIRGKINLYKMKNKKTLPMVFLYIKYSF